MTLQLLFISIARMHHIVSPSKFRRLKRHAAQASISGLVKTGKPGVLVLEGDKQSISSFLEAARGLRYLEFHHVGTRPLPQEKSGRLARGMPGLHDVGDMKALVKALEMLDLKSWFRTEMSMDKGPRS